MNWTRSAIIAAIFAFGFGASALAQTALTRAQNEANINAAIKANGIGAITGPILNTQLNNLAASMATGLDPNTFSEPQTMSGALTYGGVTLSNSVTGTGSMVLSASPALTGTLSAAISNFNIGFPASFGSTPINSMTINTGNYPLSNQMPAGVPQGLSVMMNVPSSYTQEPWPSTAISAYTLSANTNVTGLQNSSAAYYGWSGSAGEFVNPYGENLVVCNCSAVNPTTGTGFDFSGLTGLELDFNIMKVGSAAPEGNAFGLKIIGASEVAPAQTSQAIDIFGLGGITFPAVKWATDIDLENGSATNAIIVGTAAASGNNLSSMTIEFASVTSGAVNRFASIFTDANSDLILTPGAAGQVVDIPATYGFIVGAGASITSTGPGGALGNPAFVASSVSKTCGATIVVTNGVVTSC